VTGVTAPRYTSRLLKGGAALDDTRRVVELWDVAAGPEANLDRISKENQLGKASRSRLDDVLNRVIRPRFVEPGPHVIPAMKGLLTDHRAFVEASYFEASRSDALLAGFAEGPLWEWWHEGRTGVTVGETTSWLEKVAAEGRAPNWTTSVRTRTAQGLLSTLRDFGVLRGLARSPRKEFVPPAMSPRGFSYVAWREHERGASSRALVYGSMWHRWLLDTPSVLSMFGQAARLGVLRFSSAGSVVRVDWLSASLAEVTGAAA
jgi:Putative inner membrane protein (DUF1819)